MEVGGGQFGKRDVEQVRGLIWRGRVGVSALSEAPLIFEMVGENTNLGSSIYVSSTHLLILCTLIFEYSYK